MKIYDITDIDELHMSYTVNFKIQLKWFDSRITFRNLKPTDYENKLDISEIEKIWTSKLYIDLLEILTIYVFTWQSRYVSHNISLTLLIDQ